VLEPLDVQFYRVSVMALAGVASGILFDVYRIFRWATSPKGLIVYVEDMVFWLVLTPLLVFSLLVSNWIGLRLYLFLGFAAGFGSYLLAASPVVLLVLKRLAGIAARVVSRSRRFLARARVRIASVLAPQGGLRVRFERAWGAFARMLRRR
jgi:spore cortex biosynthesis protein YabQ